MTESYQILVGFLLFARFGSLDRRRLGPNIIYDINPGKCVKKRRTEMIPNGTVRFGADRFNKRRVRI